MHKNFLFLWVFFLFASPCIAQPGALDLSFNPQAGADLNIRTIARQPDGKFVIGGDFSSYNSVDVSHLARIQADGSRDTGFAIGSGFAGGYVYAIAIQNDGKIIAAGSFNSFNGIPAGYIVRLLSSGFLDTTFHTGAGFNMPVYAVTIQSDGKILVGGLFTTYAGATCNRIVRLNTDGLFDSIFSPFNGADGSVEAITVQQDHQILIAGDFTSFDSQQVLRVVRVDTTGKRDSTFLPAYGADAVIYDMAIQPNFKIILAGNFASYNFSAPARLSRIHKDAALDAVFNDNGTGANNHVFDVEALDNGRVLFAGNFTAYNGQPSPRIGIVDSTGNVDSVFSAGIGPNVEIDVLAIQPDGKIIIAGDFTTYNGIYRNRIARLYNCLTQQPTSITGNSIALCAGTTQIYSAPAVSGATKYEWTLPQGWSGTSDSAIILAVSNGSGGVISVRAFTDSCGYSYPTTKTITTMQPLGVPLCLVTVDTQSTHNIVIWEKPVTELIDSFFIYRETSTNVYSKIASVPYGALSEYHDTAANPNTTSYRYRLSVLDTCGAESDLSLYHNTIHLQNLGSGNFQWTFYQIENSLNPVLSFNIYRDNLGNGNFTAIGNVPGTNATFSDVTFNSFPNSLYVVDANWSISCTPTRAVNTTRSNIRHKNAIDNPMGTGEMELLLNEMIQVYPNPAKELLYITIPEVFHAFRLQLFNAIGQIVIGRSVDDNSTTLNISMLPAGIYTLAVETGSGKAIKKIVIE